MHAGYDTGLWIACPGIPVPMARNGQVASVGVLRSPVSCQHHSAALLTVRDSSCCVSGRDRDNFSRGNGKTMECASTPYTWHTCLFR